MKTITITKPRDQQVDETDYLNTRPQYRSINDASVEIVVPVLNEARALADSIKMLHTFMRDKLPYHYVITIVDNGSTDDTLRIARWLARDIDTVRVVSVGKRGRGRALKAACSGATTESVLFGSDEEGGWGEGPQVTLLSEDTQVVTITIGGNDVGFKEFAIACLNPFDVYVVGPEGTCDTFTPIYADTVDRITYDLPAKLRVVYAKLLEDAPNADIYVLGYPRLAPFKSPNDPFIQTCGGLYDTAPNYWGDARAAYDIVNRINGVIEDAVDSVSTNKSTSRLVYVDVSTGAFVDGNVCSTDPYFNGVNLLNREYSAHPNEKGHAAYADDLMGYID